MDSQPHHCSFTGYGCGHKIIDIGCSDSNRRFPVYRGGRTAHGQRAHQAMYVGHDCPNCMAKKAKSFGVAVG